MARNRKTSDPVADPEEPDVMDDADERDQREERDQRGSGEARPVAYAPRKPAGASLLRIFKPYQGKRVRLVTAVASGVILVGAAWWINKQLYTAGFIGGREWLSVLISLGVCAPVAVLVWYLVGAKPTSVDFLVATESEMKKVTWSTRKEVWGATKVVVGMVILLSTGLFLVDILFMWFFSLIKVLKSPWFGN